ncbi:hypothetical protein AALK46_12705 [Staphylococcus nepalensis]|uniref:hypothetical protein n=1 Tax=Staphylococcus nepalensis TaxID=214473 RepID=UPI0035119186
MERKGYGVVFVDDNGGEMVEVFPSRENALIEINKMKRTFEIVGHTGAKVYLSELRYDIESKQVLDYELVNQSSQLKVEC